MPPEIQIRTYNPDTDEALIYNSFLNSYIRNALKDTKYPLPSMIRHIDRSLFFKYYTSELNTIMLDPNLEVLVACWTARPDEIFGWCIKQDANLIYVYVKEKYRGRGVARALVMKLFDSQPYIKYSTSAGIGLVRHLFDEELS